MKTSTVLKRAKSILANSDSEMRYTTKQGFICYCIYNVTYKKNRKEGERVATIMQDRLYPHATLENWLQGNHRIRKVRFTAKQHKYTAYRDKVQQTRHAWIDSMIKEFTAKGD